MNIILKFWKETNILNVFVFGLHFLLKWKIIWRPNKAFVKNKPQIHHTACESTPTTPILEILH